LVDTPAVRSPYKFAFIREIRGLLWLFRRDHNGRPRISANARELVPNETRLNRAMLGSHVFNKKQQTAGAWSTRQPCDRRTNSRLFAKFAACCGWFGVAQPQRLTANFREYTRIGSE